jgi:hypothetical protein
MPGPDICDLLFKDEPWRLSPHPAAGPDAGATLVQPDTQGHGADGDVISCREAETMTTKTTTLYTIGYGNRQPDDFFAMLPADCTVIDVRRSPRGWHAEYGEQRLRARLGRRYLSWPALGNSSGSADTWTPAEGVAHAWGFLDALISHIETGGVPVVLMCAEADPLQCHRRFVAEEIARRVPGLQFVHL